MNEYETSQWTNWAGNQTCRPARIVAPRDVEELQLAVADAAAAGLGVRVVGSGYSFTPLACTSGVMVDVSGLTGAVAVDAELSTARAPAGTTVRDLASSLWERGFSLLNMGDIDNQTIAGALGTATHGSGLRLKSFSGALRSADYVAADGSAQSVGSTDPTLDGFRTSLGVLGILTTVEVDVAPAYKLRERIEYWSLDEALERWHKEMAERRHFSFFWGPQDRSLGLYGLADPARSSHDCYVKLYDELAVDAENSSCPGQRIGPAHEICPMQFDKGWHELEYFVAYDQALDALAEVRQVMKRHPDQAYPMEVRAIAADSAWMSPMSGRDSVSISVSGVAGTDYWPYLNDVDSSLIEFNGRAHWGKLHFMDAERLAKVYPHFSDFVDLRRSLDPQGLFLNDHLASLVS